MRRRSERGQNLAEVAIITPLLLLLLAGIADLGRAFNNYVIITNAAREGARIASRLPCDPSNRSQRDGYLEQIVAAVVQEAAASGIDLSSANSTIAVAPDPAVGCAAIGNPVRVQVTYQFATILSGILNRSELTLQNDAAMSFFGND